MWSAGLETRDTTGLEVCATVIARYAIRNTGRTTEIKIKNKIKIKMAVLTDIKSLTREELEAQFAAWEQPVYRVKQLMDWLYVQRVTDWDAMSNLPKAERCRAW